MANVNLRSLVSKLNPVCRQALEGAAGLCMTRTNYDVTIQHWLLKLLDAPNTDLAAVIKHYGLNPARLAADLTKSIDKLRRGNSETPGLHPDVVRLAREAWLVASLESGSALTRSGHLLVAMLSEDALAQRALDASEELAKVPVETLRKELAGICANTAEAQADVAAAASPAPGGQPGLRPAGPTKTPNLDQFTIDLTERARQGKIDPVLGRDPEIRLIVDILTRRRQNNPILTGEAGVGKTAVVEGFAQRIADGDVPPALKYVSLRSLDLGLLQAGAGIKGEFENRLKGVIEEVKASPKPIIVFIDEAHTLIGAGGQAGQGDAANLLKPALARGELRTIAATTWAEYKKYFEKDAALARRFQVVKVEEPDEPTACRMIRGLVGTLEKHHNVRILDEALTEAVRLSNRYISGRQLPDKAVSLIDTACARVAIGHNSTPPALEDCRRRIDAAAVSIEILTRESAVGVNHKEKLAELAAQKEAAEREFAATEKRWHDERQLVDQIRQLRLKLEGTPAPQQSTPGQSAGSGSDRSAAPDSSKLLADLEKLTADLRKLQGESPLMQVCVDGQSVAEVVAGWTGIPVGRMVSDEIRTILNLKQKLEERIVGQSHALDAIAQAIRTSRANMTDPRKPIGVFLMVGTSGTGKTETAIALAELLYGGDQNMTVINMSEFKEEHKVSLLMGSPPGYVGYGEGGVLTEAVRRKPYSVVLLDEMEKAHPGVQDVFFQVFDKGAMKDGEGRDIDFKNTVIIMTSNAATDLVLKLCADPETRPDPVALAEALHPELTKTFKPAFLGRVNIIPYFPLADDVMRKIIQLKLRGVERRVRDNYRASFTYAPEVVSHIADRCREVHTGGRNIDHIINRTLLPELSAEFLSRMAEGTAIRAVNVSVGADGTFTYAID